MKEERRDETGNDAIWQFCDICQTTRKMIVEPVYPKLPQILIVHLLRFNNRGEKHQVATPVPFTMDCFCTECKNVTLYDEEMLHRYNLISAIVHLGGTA